MDAIPATEVAHRLGTSVPRVTRAIRRLGMTAAGRGGGRVRLNRRQFQQLQAELGVLPQVDGLRRVEARVLAALARAPRGLLSVRAVARRAGVSPTAAAAAVRSLNARGLVRSEREWVAAGRPREVEVIRADVTSPDWPALAPHLAAIRSPVQPSPKRPTRLPGRLRHLFWNADPTRLDLERHGGYIAERLLSSGDLDALAWGLRALTPADWNEAARHRGLTPAQRAFARNIARSAPA